MKIFISTLILLSSFSALAFPVMSTKEKVRLELWFHGISEANVKPSESKRPAVRPLPIELEQALLKF